MSKPNHQERVHDRFAIVILPGDYSGSQLESLVEGVRKTLGGHETWGITVVDSGAAMLAPTVERLGRRVSIRRLVRGTAFGLDRAVAAALESEARGQVVVTMEVGQSHDPRLIPQMLAELEKGYDVVLAKDTSSCFRTYRASFLRKMLAVYGPTDFLTEKGIACTVELLMKGGALGARVTRLTRRQSRAGSNLRKRARDPNRLEWVHRSLSMGLAAAVIGLAIPLFAIVGFLVQRRFSGSVFVKHRKIGVDRRSPHARGPLHDRREHDFGGRPFELLKFRTAEDARFDHGGTGDLSPADTEAGALGDVLRRSRIDELPQLFNVLRGEMNLVGPRPVSPGLVERLRETSINYPIRHRVRPGVTGRAQVKQFAASSFEELGVRTLHDIQYVASRSVLGDFGILAKTVPVVVTGKGAS